MRGKYHRVPIWKFKWNVQNKTYKFSDSMNKQMI